MNCGNPGPDTREALVRPVMLEAIKGEFEAVRDFVPPVARVLKTGRDGQGRDRVMYRDRMRRYQKWVRLGRPGGEFKEWKE